MNSMRAMGAFWISLCLMFGFGCGKDVKIPVERRGEQGRWVDEVSERRGDGGMMDVMGLDGGEPGGEGAGFERVVERGKWQNRDVQPWEWLYSEQGLPPEIRWEKPGVGFLQKVVSFSPGAGASHGHFDFPKNIEGRPQGSGRDNGSLDVVSLGCGGTLTLEFSSPLIANGPGPDFVIFENAFGEDGQTFSEPAQISVSVDGRNWVKFPCDPKKSKWPYPKCAGVRPVFSNSDNKIDPMDPKQSGGDAFDLEDVKMAFARFVRIEDRSRELSEAAIWCGGPSGGFDLDAVVVLWGFHPKKP